MNHEFPEYPDNWGQIIKIVKKRDNYTCQKCLTKFPKSSKSLRVHHVISLSKGGSNNTSNLTTICKDCHDLEHPHLRARIDPVFRKQLVYNKYKSKYRPNGFRRHKSFGSKS